MRPVPYVNPIGHIDQITQDGFRFTISQPGGLRRPDRRRPGGGAAPLRGDRRRSQGAGNRNRRGPGRGQIRRHRALGVSRNTVYRSWGRAGNREQRPRSRPGKVGLRAKAWTRARTSRPTSPRPVWPMRRAMTSQTNPHGQTGDPEARWGADLGDSAPAHRGFPGEHPVPSANAGEPVTSRGKRALAASRSIPRETPVLQIRRQSAETLDESIPGSYHFRIH